MDKSIKVIGLVLLMIWMLGVGLRLASSLAGAQDVWADPSRDAVAPLRNTDGYYYLSLAQAWSAGAYQERDARSFVPEGVARPRVVPLLAVATETLALAFSTPREKIAFFLPALIGPLLLLPVFLLGRQYYGDRGAVAAAFFSVISTYYVTRTDAGWFDTDMLNVTLATTLAYLVLRIQQCATLERCSKYVATTTAVLCVFLWWWQTVHVVVLGLMLLPLALSLTLSSPGRQLLKQGGPALLVTAALLLWAAHHWGWIPVATLKSLFDLVAGLPSGPYPAPGSVIAETQSLSIATLGNKLAGHWLIAAVATVGLLGLIAQRKTRTLPLAGIALIAGLAPTAVRFVIFATPLYALGMGYLWTRLHSATAGWPKILGFVLSAFVLGLAAWWPIQAGIGVSASASRWRPYHIQAMQRLRWITEPNAVIWTAWGHGYPTRYFSGRGTLADGGHNDGRTIYNVNFPMAAEDARLAANWMNFYAARGPQGLRYATHKIGGTERQATEQVKALLAVGPQPAAGKLRASRCCGDADAEELLRFLFPADAAPLYVLITDLWTSYRWYAMGAWDLKNRKAPRQVYRTYERLQTHPDSRRLSGKRVLQPSESIDIDIDDGRFAVYFGASPVARNRLASLTDPAQYQGPPIQFDSIDDLHFEIAANGGFGILADGNSRASLMHRLYTNRPGSDVHFELIQADFPRVMVWKVVPDRYPGSGYGQ